MLDSREHPLAEPKYIYPPNQSVRIDMQFIGKEGTAIGRIKGIASHVPGLSTMWIVELNHLLPNHPYPCINVPETALTPLREPIYTNSSFTIRERVLNYLSYQDKPVELEQLHQAMPDLLPGIIDACCHQLGNADLIDTVTHPRPNGGYVRYFSARPGV